MEVLVAYFQQPGKKSDIINLANKLLVQPTSSCSRPIDRTQHIRPQEPYYEMDSSNDVESMRKALLNLELQDRTLQRRLIEPPKEFAIGHSSIGDHDRVRMEKVKLYFPSAFGGRKFSGKKNSEPGIIELLNDYNNAQEVMKLTKMEFLQFLTRAMIGDAHSTMIGYLDLFRRGQMSIEDIYLSLTDLYFTEMRPAAALDRLHSFSENSHPYSSLSEAHNGILYLANLASLASRTEQRQEALCSDYYQQALIKIIPKEYKSHAVAAFEQCGNLKQADLAPHEMLSCLNRLRQPIDELLRKSHGRSERGRDRTSAITKRQVRAVNHHRTDSPMSISPSPSTSRKRNLSKKGENSKKQGSGKLVKQAKAAPPRRVFAKKERKPGAAPDSWKPPETCRLCGNQNHWSQNCRLYAKNERAVAKSPCRMCNSGLYHYSKFCHHLKNPKN